jgi:hypothetical protein
MEFASRSVRKKGRAKAQTSVPTDATKKSFPRYGENPLQEKSVNNWNAAKNYFDIFLSLKEMPKFDLLTKEDLENPQLYQEFAGFLVEDAVMSNGDSLSQKSIKTYMSGERLIFLTN